MWQSIAGLFREHPIISGVFVGLTVGGVMAGVVYLPAEWHLARRVAAGALSGAGCALLITAHRMFS